jgi:hypothetical protein
MKTELQCAAHVAKHSLHQGKVRGTRCMHVQTDLLHCVGDIRTRQRKILKSTGETPVLGSIIKRVTIITRKLSLSVNRGSHRMAI